jgi:CheY-like chemotaxis protein
MAILIVEDEVGTRLALASQLKQFGQVIAVRNAHEARRELQSISKGSKLELAVIDLRLPVNSGIDPDSGFQIIELLQLAFPSTPIIIVTVRNDLMAWEHCHNYPSVRYFFTKPWSSEELMAAAKDCLKGTAVGLKLMGKVEGIDEDVVERRGN